MKIRYIILGLAFLSLASCGDGFLDSELLTAKTEGNFYKSPQDAELALIGAYDGLQQVWGGGISFPVATEVFSDNCFGGTGASDGFGYQMIDEFDKAVSPSDLNVFESNWAAYYKAIFRTNKLLQNFEKIEWGSNEDAAKRVEAEAKFVRALCYFQLVQMFGNIPLVEVPTLENLPQANPDEVYALITADLKTAIEKLPSNAYSASWAASSDGRATKWAAEALMARVYLYYTGYYGKTELPGGVNKAKALEYVLDVVNNSGHGLVENFSELWPASSVQGYAGEGNKETVFAIKYTYTSDWNGNADGNHWMVMFGMRQTDSYPYGRGWGGGTVNPKLFNAFKPGDARKTASIISIQDEQVEIDVATQREYTGYYVKKYSPMSTADGKSVAESLGGVSFQISQFQDFVVLRYADVLLMAAELGAPDAQAYFDQVRQRAFKDAFVSIPVNTQNLREERRLEFAFEGVRYWDLLRYGLDVAASAINESGVTVKNGGVDVVKKISFNSTSKGLQQIPYNQINLSNGVLKQNAGW